MKTARVAWNGAVHRVVADPGGVQLSDGRVLGEHEVIWLPPVEPLGTIIALGLNYADHVKELSRELQPASAAEPLVFFKGPASLVGHRATTRRPRDATFMHYECELAVVMGEHGRVAGYTVANDYAVRDYLENWYRPNLRAKNRDGATVLGPWLVDVADVPDPQDLSLRTLVNGVVTQRGHTGAMIHSVAALIEYLGSFMTLAAGDVILTGTPDGVVNVNPGDEVVTEIDGIGRLVNTIASEDDA